MGGVPRTSTPTHNTDPENPMATLLFTLLPFAVTFTAAAFSPAEPTLPTDRPTPLRTPPPATPAEPGLRCFAVTVRC
jgi:hypothetical protein